MQAKVRLIAAAAGVLKPRGDGEKGFFLLFVQPCGIGHEALRRVDHRQGPLFALARDPRSIGLARQCDRLALCKARRLLGPKPLPYRFEIAKHAGLSHLRHPGIAGSQRETQCFRFGRNGEVMKLAIAKWNGKLHARHTSPNVSRNPLLELRVRGVGALHGRDEPAKHSTTRCDTDAQALGLCS